MQLSGFIQQREMAALNAQAKNLFSSCKSTGCSECVLFANLLDRGGYASCYSDMLRLLCLYRALRSSLRSRASIRSRSSTRNSKSIPNRALPASNADDQNNIPAVYISGAAIPKKVHILAYHAILILS